MPYIHQNRRRAMQADLTSLADQTVLAGDLAYAITYLAHKFVDHAGLNYANLAKVLGILEGCKLEFYDKVVGPYEGIKIRSNGPVSQLDRLR